MHLRLNVMARDWMEEQGFEVLGAYFSPVGDAYGKKGLASSAHRVEMLHLATSSSDFIMVDEYETLQPQWTETVKVLRHFDEHIKSALAARGVIRKVHVMLVCGSDLLDSFNTPNLWAETDQNEILGSYGLVTLERVGADPAKIVWSNDIMYPHRSNIFIVKQWIPNDISSTLVRRALQRQMSVDYLLPESVVRYIYANSLYGAKAASAL
jgi:nicotinamide mononucleotide adenylyltransferase